MSSAKHIHILLSIENRITAHILIDNVHKNKTDLFLFAIKITYYDSYCLDSNLVVHFVYLKKEAKTL